MSKRSFLNLTLQTNCSIKALIHYPNELLKWSHIRAHVPEGCQKLKIPTRPPFRVSIWRWQVSVLNGHHFFNSHTTPHPWKQNLDTNRIMLLRCTNSPYFGDHQWPKWGFFMDIWSICSELIVMVWRFFKVFSVQTDIVEILFFLLAYVLSDEVSFCPTWNEKREGNWLVKIWKLQDSFSSTKVVDHH